MPDIFEKSVQKVSDGVELEEFLSKLADKYGKNWVVNEIYGWECSYGR